MKATNVANTVAPVKTNTCSRILTPKQVGPICWFMATFVAMFYSQRSRKLLLEASKDWDKKKELFTLLKHVLDDKYLKVASRESEDYKKFSDDTFGEILLYLNRENNKTFPYDPKKVSTGFVPEYYVGKLYKLLNVDYKMFNFYTKDNNVAYSHLNEDYDIMSYTISNKMIRIEYNNYELRNLIYKPYKYVENNYAPPILIIKVDEKEVDKIYNVILEGNKLNEGYMKEQLKSMSEQIFYNGKEYNLDAVILANWNKNKRIGHAIAGITCKKNKYVYNGWTRRSMDPAMADKNITRNIPCELMKYDWNIIKHNDFCLNTIKCIPELLKRKLKVKDLCFNFSKGSRILIYVRKDAKPYTSIETNTITNSVVPVKPIVKPKSLKKCPEGKVLNPKTGRCILIKKKLSDKPKPPSKPIVKRKPPSKPIVKRKSLKKCPESKVLNPKTGRCILIRNKK